VRTLKLTLAYDGTEFVGWQRQAEGRSVQGVLEDAVSRLDGRPVSINGAGRTDAGVHATGQVASLVLHESDLDGTTIRRALNAVLPRDIRIVAVDEVAEGFHARYDAVSKTYHYRLINGPVVSPFAARYVWHVPWSLDLASMDDAARRLVGEHDFGAFQSTGGDVRTTTREIFESSIAHVAREPSASTLGEVPAIADSDGRVLVYSVTGSGFLRHMVRAIVGTLVEIGSGRSRPELMNMLLAQRDRAEAGPTAPALGLCLASVRYPADATQVAAHR
jgi:tRNA pseudouridine38-40 synthase